MTIWRRNDMPLASASARHHRDDAGQNIIYVKRDLFEVELAGFHLREIEDVVDDRKKRLAGFLDGFRELALGRREVRPQHQPGHSQNAVQGRPNLVAHRRQEFGLCLVGRLGKLLRLDQRALCHLAFRHVAQRHRDRGFSLPRDGAPDTLAVELGAVQRAQPELSERIRLALRACLSASGVKLFQEIRVIQRGRPATNNLRFG